jgi:hypothetical protein
MDERIILQQFFKNDHTSQTASSTDILPDLTRSITAMSSSLLSCKSLAYQKRVEQAE